MRALRTPTISGLRQHLARIRQAPKRPTLDGALEPHPPVRALKRARETAVDRYWTGHTVRAERFRTPAASERSLEWRFDQYPLFREFSGLWGERDGEVVLDYGCGPGNDLTGFALYTGARKVIGIDVSETALERAAQRLALHGIAEDRVELIRAGDAEPEIPLDDRSVDHVNCQGVLHHTTDPAAILNELARVLRPGGTGCIMVYNQRSVWFHLYTAYERMIVEDAFPGLEVHQAFARNTDGPDCPISRSYPPEDFTAMCREAGFRTDYVGGYLSVRELQSLRDSFASAISDHRLADEHRSFLRELRLDVRGLPMHGSHHAGIGGTYRLLKSGG
jgi:ubiquinone/menaquinone biosynthesis C-methylase UbiE